MMQTSSSQSLRTENKYLKKLKFFKKLTLNENQKCKKSVEVWADIDAAFPKDLCN